ncbi:unnamed protein product [Brachionus calyciflorus]|uniref:Tc1-like transposase DDE domain-containing protein n=1 Tax=Brachionus calyciflorus TaxID=104777 RepID=A0A814PUG9_9BILA|nr:unnamed protein product [Brachionus calyciflorus]
MNSSSFQNLFSDFINPFILENYALSHRLYMDNDPKHTSFSTYEYLEQNFVNHFRSPPQSPDLNPIELVWNDLKYFLETFFKPNSLSDLIIGINRFWDQTVTVDYCNRKIDHIFRVINKTIEYNGQATGL